MWMLSVAFIGTNRVNKINKRQSRSGKKSKKSKARSRGLAVQSSHPALQSGYSRKQSVIWSAL